MSFDYDIVFPCACCGNKSTNYLCGKCAKEHCPSCAALRAESKMFRERWELEQIRYEGISSANEELRARLEALEKENAAFVEELKCHHDGNDGDDVHYCGKCDDHVASAEEIRENILDEEKK